MEWNEEERFGAMIVKRACEEPLRQIASNAGLDGAIILDRVLANKSASFGLMRLKSNMKTLLKLV